MAAALFKWPAELTRRRDLDNNTEREMEGERERVGGGGRMK